MVFAYSKEAVGRLERDVCAARARIRELEAALARKDAALAAVNTKLQDAIDYHNAAEDTHANDTRELLKYIKAARALIATALTAEEVKR